MIPSYEERLQALRQSPGEAALFEGFADAAERSIRSVRAQIDPAMIERAAAVLAGALAVAVAEARR